MKKKKLASVRGFFFVSFFYLTRCYEIKSKKRETAKNGLHFSRRITSAVKHFSKLKMIRCFTVTRSFSTDEIFTVHSEAVNANILRAPYAYHWEPKNVFSHRNKLANEN